MNTAPLDLTQLHTLAQFEHEAGQRLSRDYFNYVAGGAGDESEFQHCRRHLDSIRLVNRVLRGTDRIDTRVCVLGHECSHPILLAPAAYLGEAHPHGEIAAARAAKAFGTVMTLSTLASEEMGEVQRQSGAPLWLQLYIYRDRDITQEMVARAAQAGYTALVLTVDQPTVGIRYRDRASGFKSPASFCLNNVLSEETRRRKGIDAASVQDFLAAQRDARVTWDDLRWLRSLTDLPILLKGVLSPEDARIGMAHGAAGIIVSNHGGRQLDGLVSPVAALPKIRAVLGSHAPILVDGGIRYGTDVIRCLCLGANAVLIGRPMIWGLAVGGTQGLLRVLNLLAEETTKAMSILGAARIDELDAGFLFNTPGS